MTYIWLGVAILAVIVEAITVQMVAIWFAPAALIAMVSNLLGAPVWLQVMIFVLISALCVAFLYKKLRKNIHDNCAKTNLDAIIGSTAIVENEIPPQGLGRVKVRGMSWQAYCEEGAKVGEHLIVTAIDGVTLKCVKSSNQTYASQGPVEATPEKHMMYK